MAIDYERVMWDTTKYVNPQNMNQMDEGIKAACDAVDNMSFDETMTYAEYQALTPEQKADGTTRYIPDYNIGQSVIDNDSTSGTRTWGADKLSSNFSAINNSLTHSISTTIKGSNNENITLTKFDTGLKCIRISEASSVPNTEISQENIIPNEYRPQNVSYLGLQDYLGDYRGIALTLEGKLIYYKSSARGVYGVAFYI